jgi:transposase
MLRLEDFMEIQKLHHDGVSVSEIARHLDMDRKTVRKYLKQAPREYERKPKSWSAQRCEVIRGDPEARLLRGRDAGEGGGRVLEDRGPGACVRALRDRAGRAGADGLGALRQLGR